MNGLALFTIWMIMTYIWLVSLKTMRSDSLNNRRNLDYIVVNWHEYLIYTNWFISHIQRFDFLHFISELADKKFKPIINIYLPYLPMNTQTNQVIN